MAFRKISMSRNRLIAAYWRDGVRQPLRLVADELGVCHNTARNWLIRFGLYESVCPGRKYNAARNKPKHIDNA